MGIGDELMASGHARRMSEEHGGKRVAIVDQHGWIRKHDLWANVPYIATLFEKGVLRVRNCGGHRPYIAAKGTDRWTWRKYTPYPATIVFTPEEEAFGREHGGRIVIEPNVKEQKTGHRNKDWGFLRYQELANRRPGAFIQVGDANARGLLGVPFVRTPTFRLAAAVLKHSRMYVGPEGGLHHAAAAVGVPAIVIFGGFISPDQTGYKGHRNLFTGGTPCGMRTDCQHCRQAMAMITVGQVHELIDEVLHEVC